MAKLAQKNEHIAGFIVCQKSPTCGMERVKAQLSRSRLRIDSIGMFTKQLMDHNPLLPIEENGRLNDPILRENS
ncbi:2-thiouracil desulfurase family protein [Vibrio fortis]|uniref:2-thiouracil desulfurase family protein n=1 Tax=Vibrio fortis TaxID=212667 RepID=UPI001CD99605|nr:2-thiouracil desulfurase family protein [Vibrio fortis]